MKVSGIQIKNIRKSFGVAVTLVMMVGWQLYAKQPVVEKQYYDKYKNGIVEEVTFYSRQNPNSDKEIARRGILVRRAHAKATLLVCHGFLSEEKEVACFRLVFPDYNIMTFDFRAHGQNSNGQYSTLGRDEAYDVLAAAHFLKAHPDLKDLPIIAYGFSMGAVAAIEAQKKEPELFQAMVLDGPFDSTENLLRRGLQQVKISIMGYQMPLPGSSLLERMAFYRYTQPVVQFLLKIFAGFDAKNKDILICDVKPQESIKKVTVPCYFILCRNDEKVSVPGIKLLFDGSASEHKKLWITDGKSHCDSFFHDPERYASKVQKFINTVINGDLNTFPKGKISDDQARKGKQADEVSAL